MVYYPQANLAHENVTESRLFWMKKLWILLLCAALAFTLAGCQSSALDPAAPSGTPTEEPVGQINGALGWRVA
jgi:hypothetical protein